MRFHVSCTDGTAQVTRRGEWINWTNDFLFQTNTPGTAFVHDRTEMFATHEHPEAAGAVKNRSSIQLRGLQAV